MTEMSNLHKYSIGIIARDIEEDSKFVEIFPVENQTYTDGEIDSTEDITVDNEDIYGKKQKILIPKRVTVVAEWLALGNSNRISAPNVKKGEEVIIYRYANTDRFYWVTMFNELDLRRKEKVIHYYGNTDNFKEELNEENAYWTKIDTINKEVHIHTSDNDGELTTYDIKIDTENGILEIIDGKNNFFNLDSAEDKLTINTNKDIHAITDNYTTDVGTDRTDTIGSNKTINIGSNKTETIGAKYAIELSTYSVSNGSNELMALLVETMQAIIDIEHTGNLGIPTAIEASSESVFKDLKSRYASFM